MIEAVQTVGLIILLKVKGKEVIPAEVKARPETSIQIPLDP